MFLKWLIFNSITLFVVAYLVQFHNALGLLLIADPTRVTLLILAIYIAITVYLGIKGEYANFDAVKFWGTRMPALGLIGTIVGIMMLFASADDVDFKKNIANHMAPIFITAAFGIGFNTRVQTAICFERWDDAE